MSVLMEEKTKVRLVLSVEGEIRDALRLESAFTHKDMSDIIADLVREHLPDAVNQVRRRRMLREKKKD